MPSGGPSRFICRVRLRLSVHDTKQPSPATPIVCLLVPGPLKGYTLVAHRSGHTLGGSLYTLRPSLSSSLSPASSASSLLYAPLFNHIKEHHLDPTSLLSGGNVDDNMRRMGVVVVGAQRSKAVNIKRIDRERKLLGEHDFSSLAATRNFVASAHPRRTNENALQISSRQLSIALARSCSRPILPPACSNCSSCSNPTGRIRTSAESTRCAC